MEEENKEGKGKKSIVILIIAILLAIIIALSIALPLTLGKKEGKPKEATITVAASKGSGEGTFTPQKWFSKIGEETKEHTTEEAMTIKAKSEETVYFGLSYGLEYEREGGAYIENLTCNSTMVDVSYSLCPAGATDDTAYFTQVLTNAEWKTWEGSDETPTSDKYVILKFVVHKLTKDENVAVGLDFAVVDGENLGIPLNFTLEGAEANNYYTQINGKSKEYDSKPNFYINEGETIYVGIYMFGVDNGGATYNINNLTSSEGITVSYDIVNLSSYEKPTIDEFNNGITSATWTTFDYYDSYGGSQMFLILKIEANESISTDSLSIELDYQFIDAVE